MSNPESTEPPATPTHIGVFDLFRVGIGPSSSHTVGPMLAARHFMQAVAALSPLPSGARLTCDLFGSLALTGRGHATDVAVIAGLAGADPAQTSPEEMARLCAKVGAEGSIETPQGLLAFRPAQDLRFNKGVFLAEHPNAMTLGLHSGETTVVEKTYYSIGGGFIRVEGEAELAAPEGMALPYPFTSGASLLAISQREGLSIAEVQQRNEQVFRTTEEIEAGLDRLWVAMKDCIARGLTQNGTLPGGLGVKRRAADLHAKLLARDRADQSDPLRAMEWVNLYALAVNEENAAGGRVVTAPTNGAAGIVPAVLGYYETFVRGAQRSGMHRFLLTAAAIGALIKRNASISGADVGCQGEVGSAAAMAAAGLAAALGGSSAQIENAAEIALEHNLGLTCDPVGGLVQIPCIERNAVASMKAINAARLALQGDGSHRVSLDQVIETMRQTGQDMKSQYKETSLAGLAVNVSEC